MSRGRRPHLDDAPLVRHDMRLSKKHYELIKFYGNGNATEGLRKILDKFGQRIATEIGWRLWDEKWEE